MNPDYIILAMNDIEERYENSRERSLAMTKLEEARMWLHKAETK